MTPLLQVLAHLVRQDRHVLVRHVDAAFLVHERGNGDHGRHDDNARGQQSRVHIAPLCSRLEFGVERQEIALTRMIYCILCNRGAGARPGTGPFFGSTGIMVGAAVELPPQHIGRKGGSSKPKSWWGFGRLSKAWQPTDCIWPLTRFAKPHQALARPRPTLHGRENAGRTDYADGSKITRGTHEKTFPTTAGDR